MASPIPTISLDEIKKGKALPELAAAAVEKGIFYLTDSGLLDEDHRSARQTCVNFLINGTETEKRAVTNLANPNIRRGFSGLGWESTAVITEGTTYTDYSTCYSMGREGNLFPNENFARIWQNYFDRLYTISQHVASGVFKALGSGVPEHYLSSIEDNDPLFRLRYFPEVSEDRAAEEQPLRMAPHYDLSIITLIHQTACANGFISLQCEIDGEFVDVPTIPGALLVFCGAVATLATGGRVKAPRHRVKAPSGTQRVGSARTSSVFFLRPKPDFSFRPDNARKWGLDVQVPTESTTFEDWMGFNYANSQTRAAASEQRERLA